jgi:hypothetical protein
VNFKRQLTNPYWAALLVPLAVFLALVRLGVSSDDMSFWARLYTFAILGYVGARYVGRAPFLIWQRDLTPQARNVTGWGIALVGFMAQIGYGWVYVNYDRPAWLASQYWSVSFVTLIALGMTIVATSVPRLPPFGGGRNGLSELASALVVALGAFSVFVASHVPQAIALLKAAWGSAVSAF